MKLTHTQIQLYKSIEDTEEFRIDDVTCLVGKNEAGKTAILEALYKLNPIESEKSKFSETDYPRRFVSTYREREESNPATVLTTKWLVEDADIEYIKSKIGYDPFKTRELTITKDYGNFQYWYTEYNEEPMVQHLVKKAELDSGERDQFAKVKTITELEKTLEGKDALSSGATQLLQQIKKNYPEGFDEYINDLLLDSRLPKFLYFREYDRLPGKIAINDFTRRKQANTLEFGHKIFLELLNLANSSPEDINKIGQSEQLIMELEAISNRLTEEIFEYWSQNQHLDIQFRFDAARPQDPAPFNEGHVFSTRIYNRRHRATVNFDERSTGFIWFFSFLIWFSQVRQTYGKNLIILLDEPGLTLHGTAQRDLLRYINERLRPHHQVIYTTHSPFMLDPEHIFSVRTVEDVVKKDSGGKEVIQGTKVGQSILSRDRDTLLPLQGIAGFDIAQTMFLGPHVLVVEGPSEAGYIHWFSRQLLLKGREGLDLRWAVCPAEGATKVSSFVTLFAGRGLTIAALMDYHEGQKGMVDQLEKSGLLKEGHMLKTTEFAAQTDADIEDLVGWETMRSVVNDRLNLNGTNALPKKKPDGSNGRVAKLVEEHCRTLPTHYPEFHHYMPVEYLLAADSAAVSKLDGLEKAIDRFEALFKKLNSFI